MKTGKKKWPGTIFLCAMLLLLAGYVEKTDRVLDEDNRIIRKEPGEGGAQVDLTLNVPGVLEDYPYSLDIPEAKVAKEQAAIYFAQARREIDESFFAEGESADHVTEDVHMRERYADNLVNAEWSFENYQVVDIDGHIVDAAASSEGSMVRVSAELSCGEYRDWYEFCFMVYPREQTLQEQILSAVGDEITREKEQEGQRYLYLPQKVGEYSLSWEQTREHLAVKVLFFEAITLILLHFVARERAREKERLRKEEMMLDYAEVVNKLLILLGSGMSLKQSWNRISARYSEKREKLNIPARSVYEEMLITNHEIWDGESERIAYQRFGERTGISAYHRLVRILVQNLQTGSQGLCRLLEQETETALEERKALARKLGEEAGTKMLLPLVMMLGIVIAIIMVPAMQSFKL